jgi:diacylglycerol kinase family enzyme
VVVNESCGNFEKFSKEIVESILDGKYSVDFCDIDDDYPARSEAEGFSAVAILGGDGTLNSVLNKIRGIDVKVFYLPYGTLNEKSHTLDGADPNGEILVGTVGGQVFTYVAACGTFTPIGYTAKVERKKKLKSFAYLLEVLKEYKVHSIHAKLSIDGELHEDNYTLIMVLKSPRCFKFHFNHLYNSINPTGHVLLIRSPGKNNFWNKIRIFFPFFRAFFIGFRREVNRKNLLFKEFNKVRLHLNAPVDFDVDGEKKTLEGDNTFRVKKLPHNFIVCDTRRAKRLAKKKERYTKKVLE